MREKIWKIEPFADRELVTTLSSQLQLNEVLSNILVNRGITNFDLARDFFRPELSNLHDPFLMKDMKEAIERITYAIKNNEKILVYGDYDVDGTSSVGMVYKFFKNWYKNISYYIPDRYSEGYGISIKGIDHAAETNVKLVIALDCGIKAVEKIKYATEKNVDFIICDHHTPGDELPKAVAVLDPKRADCEYPFKELSGCGVGFKLIQAYAIAMNIEEKHVLQYLDFVAVSIASDIVPIVGENRILTYYGLEKLNADPSIGMRAIIEVAEISFGKIDITDIVFKIGPRINAAGRIDSGQMAVDLLVCDNITVAREISQHIDADNQTRKEIDREITLEAIDQLSLSDDLLKKRSTVLFNPHWHKGVIGIVASRLVEQFHKPTIIFTRSNGMITGSARSVTGFNVYDAIVECADLLENYGGHMYAAGLSMLEENLEEFTERFENVVATNIKPAQIIQKIHCDSLLQITQITPKLWAQLKALRPFGPGNMAPVFVAQNVSGVGQCVGKTGAHLRLMISDKDNPQTQFPAIAFNQSQHWLPIANKEPIDICFTIEENEYRGKFSLQLRIKDIKIHTGATY
ncbi:MAG: single-stranded-DNA-specific exonuclease RecJ [Salinivirgaceae bacterium]|nr:single-stranded-DNA-specific exonuclease RecJ [Salinivirgaceae bacterium]MDY0280235.1 single-stranded-DNA-specific exonuclease RecJ [Salinivirgaceae bacterium]